MDGQDPINNYADVIDSRDVIARIEYLEALGTPDEPEDGDNEFTGLDQAEADELQALRALAKEGEGAADWQYGETLIRDSYFEDYARELAEDIGAIPRDAAWPAYCIDWERAALELQVDYFTIDFDGVTYWVR